MSKSVRNVLFDLWRLMSQSRKQQRLEVFDSLWKMDGSDRVGGEGGGGWKVGTKRRKRGGRSRN